MEEYILQERTKKEKKPFKYRKVPTRFPFLLMIRYSPSPASNLGLSNVISYEVQFIVFIHVASVLEYAFTSPWHIWEMFFDLIDAMNRDL
ncbi:CLUMA_CG013030, isoform A [Clunio marinus]|uniref:CLUMA_CG013030, isoform A n=1 Tax=Clunio marinus TaxID=568069 RepID=A0A1J1IJM8_9DIPT|nr:CLUMA_CG013030, isoform A [Clunio marinus]